jgi:hypothetical protein
VPHSNAFKIALEIGEWRFGGRLELAAAQKSVAWLSAQLPLKGMALHARWSGEAAWMPLEHDVALDEENAVTHPQPGQLLLYAGPKSVPELLIPYGYCVFGCRAGSLAGNHVITLENDFSDLSSLGKALLYKGAQPLRLRLVGESLADESLADECE